MAELGDPAKDWWTLDDIAAHWGVKKATLHSYRSRDRGELPAADEMLGRTPVWRPATITGFTRPGQGARTDLQS